MKESRLTSLPHQQRKVVFPKNLFATALQAYFVELSEMISIYVLTEMNFFYINFFIFSKKIIY